MTLGKSGKYFTTSVYLTFAPSYPPYFYCSILGGGDEFDSKGRNIPLSLSRNDIIARLPQQRLAEIFPR